MATMHGRVRASTYIMPDGRVVLSFMGDPFAVATERSAAIYLPPHMAACAAMIVEAFNAHMAASPPIGLPTGGAPTNRVMGLIQTLSAMTDADTQAAMHVEGHDGDL